MPGAPEVVQRKITRLDFKEYCEKIAQRIHWQLPPASYPRKEIYSEGSKYEKPDKGRQSQSQYAGVLEEELSEMTMRNYRNVMMPALMTAGRTDMPFM